ncbi:MAG: tetratricopeptide repeat protein [Desulfuromonadaceae bacterium]
MKKTALIIFIILGLVSIGYHGILSHDFIRFDDPDYVVNNPHVQNGFTKESMIWAFTSTECSNWHPLTWFSHILDCQLFGLVPAGHHFSSLLLHVVNSILLFLFFRQATKSEWQSALIAVLFSIHPLHVESVAWVAERKDLLYTFFWLLALIAYSRYVKSPGPGRYSVVVGLFIFSLLAKPMAVTFPFILLLLDWWPLQRFVRPQEKNWPVSPYSQALALLLEKVPFLLLAAASAAITFLVQKQGGAVSQLNINVILFHLGNAPVSYFTYIGKMFWPVDLAIFYPLDLSAATASPVGISLILLVFITILAIKIRSRYPYLLFGWLWYLVTLLPVIGILKTGAQSVADRYTYVPLIGLFIAIIWWIFEITRRLRFRRRILLAGSITILALLTVTTHRQVLYWRDTHTLFTHALAVTKDNWMAHHVLGVVEYHEGNMTGAIVHYREALRINPLNAPTWNNLGNVYRLIGNTAPAIDALQEAIRLDHRYAAPISNLGLTYTERGNVNSAMAQYNRLKEIDAGMASALLQEIGKKTWKRP